MKLLLIIFMALMVILSASTAIFIGQNLKLKDKLLTEQVDREIAEKRVEYYKVKLDEPFESEVIYHARDHKTKDFFTFMKMKGRGKLGYKIITDLPIDRDRFDLIYGVLIDSLTTDELNQAFDDWWSESRIGTNQHHSRNKDGSIDFGNFGTNYPRGTLPIKIGVVQQAKDYCKFIHSNNLMSYPPEQRRSRYYSKYWWLKDREKQRSRK